MYILFMQIIVIYFLKKRVVEACRWEWARREGSDAADGRVQVERRDLRGCTHRAPTGPSQL